MLFVDSLRRIWWVCFDAADLSANANAAKSLSHIIIYMFVSSLRHWLATYFVIWYGVPYMTYDIFAMYLSHYYRFRVKGHEDYKQHSLRTVNSFVRREFLLVLHHIALLTILLPVTLVRRAGRAGGRRWWS